jgi:hypothetical protein
MACSANCLKALELERGWKAGFERRGAPELIDAAKPACHLVPTGEI